MLGVKNIEWVGPAQQGYLRLLDQTRLPTEQCYLECRDVESVWQAIKDLSVRGAPAIGIAAAYGCVLGVQQTQSSEIKQTLEAVSDHLATSRPTAVNLFWALDRMKKADPLTASVLLDEAKKIHAEDAIMCQKIGEHALELANGIGSGVSHGPDGIGVLTHCNAGALATGGIGTATAAMYLAQERGVRLCVFVDETRPLLQGSRLTAFELATAGIDVTLICDAMAAQVMREGRVDVVITGADRIAANGDTANKIGTYNLAVLAHHHDIPFCVAAPSSSFDLSLAEGAQIPIEQRAADEITEGFGKRTAPVNIKTYSPAFDVTPHELIGAIITEKGVIQPVNAERIENALGKEHRHC